jgi:hypothetical protein
MSRTEHFDKDEQGLPGTDGSETKDSGSSRRRFIRNIAIGTAGAAIAMSNLDRLRGASRLLERLTDRHVEGFLEHIRDASESPAAKQEFERISTMILEAVDSDPKSRETFSGIKHYLANPPVTVPAGVKRSEVDMLMGAGYLRAIDGIQHTTRHVSADDVKKRLQDSKAILHIFESGFLNQLYAKTKDESASNPSFAKKIRDASRDAKGVASHLVKLATSDSEPRLIRASFLQGGCDCTVDIGNGPQCEPWEVCVGIVVIFVIILLVAK